MDPERIRDQEKRDLESGLIEANKRLQEARDAGDLEEAALAQLDLNDSLEKYGDLTKAIGNVANSS